MPLQQEKFEVFEVYAKVCSGGNRFVDYYKRWPWAFERLWRLSRREERRDYFQPATILRLHFLTGYTWIKISACSREVLYGQMTRKLREIVTLSRIIRNSSRTTGRSMKSSFGMDF
jgi:hypothetical protein